MSNSIVSPSVIRHGLSFSSLSLFKYVPNLLWKWFCWDKGNRHNSNEISGENSFSYQVRICLHSTYFTVTNFNTLLPWERHSICRLWLPKVLESLLNLYFFKFLPSDTKLSYIFICKMEHFSTQSWAHYYFSFTYMIFHYP